jgi:hypothetical protein
LAQSAHSAENQADTDPFRFNDKRVYGFADVTQEGFYGDLGLSNRPCSASG